MVVDRIQNNCLDYLTSFINISLFSDGELCFNGLCAVPQSAPYAIRAGCNWKYDLIMVLAHSGVQMGVANRGGKMHAVISGFCGM
jgi:hypothetical protein